ncbi:MULTISPECIES: hypothetical protein [unclassified Providencia]|uniref:hypothetical protein n=1 Tax=unclassified Providencia TaxID=2633465 RepID=UPI00234B5ADB|nr:MULTISPECIES: hypothetical protein [unclassified Providencia]
MKTSQHHPSVKYINQTVAAHAEMLKRGNLTTETIAESCRIKRNNLEAKYKFLNEIHSTKPTSITLSTPVKYDDNACQVQQTKIDAASIPPIFSIRASSLLYPHYRYPFPIH